jgi:hypothetical protein
MKKLLTEWFHQTKNILASKSGGRPALEYISVCWKMAMARCGVVGNITSSN